MGIHLPVYNRQIDVLKKLLARARHTEVGRRFHFDDIETYAQFRRNVPPHDYTDIQPAVERLKKGASNILWPGAINNFAVSAGTSGKGKHLPLSDERLTSDHAFMRKVAQAYLGQRPNIFKLWGDHLSMPGSLERKGKLQLGEISGFTALHVPFWLRHFQLVDPAKLTNLSFQKKFDLLLRKALQADLRVITAVPSWILTLFQQALARTAKKSIADIWPNLQLLVCGGVKLAHYKPHLITLAGRLSLDFIETYGASEGYIGFTDDLEKEDLRMPLQNGIFFEAVPVMSDQPKSGPNAIPLWQIKCGVPYALLLSTNAGLWRYRLNDIVEFTSTDPLRFLVKGRLNDMLDNFGEALHIYEVEDVLSKINSQHQMDIGTFCISPIMPAAGVPFHQWFIQFGDSPTPNELQTLAGEVDRQIQQINRHYAIRRETDALGCPRITAIQQSEINRWKERHDKANTQGKLPSILPKNTHSLNSSQED